MHIPNKNILCIGEVLWDVLGEIRKPGGAPMNVALHLSTLNHEVRMASRLGNDKDGKELLDFLQEAGLDTSQIQKDQDLDTSQVLVSLDAQNNATYEIVYPVAWDQLEYTDELAGLSANAGIIVYGSLGSRNTVSRKTIAHVLNSPGVKLIDVNLRPPYTEKSIVKKLLLKADIAKLNEEELYTIAGWDNKKSSSETELMEWLAEQYKLEIIVTTKGENGAILYEDKSFFEHPGYQIDVVDTVGAGDAFLAGYITALLREDGPEETLSFACATGALVATHSGANPYYTIEDILKIKNS